jgi:putative transposase
LYTCFPGIRLVWADSGYAGKLVDWAAEQLRLSVQIVAKLAGQTTFVVLHCRWCVERCACREIRPCWSAGFLDLRTGS